MQVLFFMTVVNDQNNIYDEKMTHSVHNSRVPWAAQCSQKSLCGLMQPDSTN